jgi:hypothetical protein
MAKSSEESPDELRNYALGKVTLRRERLLSEAEDVNIREESAFVDEVRIEDGHVVILIGGERLDD